jgi:hypothetical protein
MSYQFSRPSFEQYRGSRYLTFEPPVTNEGA